MTLEPLGQAVTISYFFRGKQGVSLINMFLTVSVKGFEQINVRIKFETILNYDPHISKP